jgi:hypothetical protein
MGDRKVIIEKIPNHERIRLRMDKIYQLSERLDEERDELRKKCLHPEIKRGNYSYRIGSIIDGRICASCDKYLGAWDEYSIRIYDFGEKTAKRVKRISEIVGTDYWIVEGYMLNTKNRNWADEGNFEFSHLKGLEETKNKIQELSKFGVNAKMFEKFGDEEREIK